MDQAISVASYKIVSRLQNAFSDWKERRAKRRLYVQTYNELSGLSNKDLADIGLNRSMIQSVAYHSVYS